MMTFIAIMVVINFILLCVSIRITMNTADIQQIEMESTKYEIQSTILEFRNEVKKDKIFQLEQNQLTKDTFVKMILQLEQKIDEKNET